MMLSQRHVTGQGIDSWAADKEEKVESNKCYGAVEVSGCLC